jgi:Tol biopolymer transport system component
MGNGKSLSLGLRFLLCLLVACAETRPVIFPNVDIVYQSSDFGAPSVGFVNADGSNQSIVELDFDLNRPVWSPDGKTLYFINPPGNSQFVEYPGRISIWREEKSVRK